MLGIVRTVVEMPCIWLSCRIYLRVYGLFAFCSPAQCSGWWYCCVGGVGGVSGGLCFSMFIVVAVTAVAVAVVVAAAAVVASVTPVKLPPACPGTTGIGAAIQHPKIGHFSSDCMVPFVKIRHQYGII